MAGLNYLQGYECDFISAVPEDFYCKKCNFVARRMTLTSCCNETYCHNCVPDICLSCGEKSFTTMEHLRNQKKTSTFQVYCSMKERGCAWSGTLDQLDAHLDPNLDNCQYVDTNCPLNCLQTIPKNKMEQHVAQECTKRPHVCQHCGFKATYEEVVDTHLPECKYVPLRCPNMCGVSCEREMMDDHMKICRLEEVECEFSSVGCDGRFIREDQDEHARQNSQKHLTLTASLAVETKEQIQLNLLEQDKKRKGEEEKLKIMQGQEMKLEEQQKALRELWKKNGGYEKKLGEQEKKLGEKQKALDELRKDNSKYERKLGEQENKLGEQEKKLGEQHKKNGSYEKKINEQEKTSRELERKLLEQTKQLVEQEKKLGEQDKNIGEQEKKLGEQKKKLGEQEKKLGEQEKKLGEQEKKLGEQEKKLGEQEKKLGEQDQNIVKLEKMISDCTKILCLNRRFVLENFTKEKKKDKLGDWKSPAMYTHVGGYKFCIGVDANGRGEGRGNSIHVYIVLMRGEFDDELKWPAEARFNVELINQQGGENVMRTTVIGMPTAVTKTLYSADTYMLSKKGYLFTYIDHTELAQFLENDSLHFFVSNVVV